MLNIPRLKGYKTVKHSEKIAIDAFIMDENIQVREGLDDETFLRYGTVMEEKGADVFPPVRLGEIEGETALYLVDGFHRVKGAELAGIEEISAEIFHYASRDEMFEDALRLNSRHGKPLTQKERRKAAEIVILRNPEATQEVLAELCGMSQASISRIRDQLIQMNKLNSDQKVEGKDGKKRKTSYTPREDKRSAGKNQLIHVNKLNSDPPPDSTPSDPEPEKLSFCAGGCGTPFYPEQAESEGSYWIKSGGKWYCSQECLDASQGRKTSPAAPEKFPWEDAAPDAPQTSPDVPWGGAVEEEGTFQFTVTFEVSVTAATREEAFKLLERAKSAGTRMFFAPCIQSASLASCSGSSTNQPTGSNQSTDSNTSRNRTEEKRRPPAPAELPEEEKTEFVFPLLDGSEYILPKPNYDQFVKLYIGIDVDLELRSCLGWNIANPQRRKTRTGILRHINTWLSSKQNSSRGVNTRPNYNKSVYKDAGVTYRPEDY